MLALVEYEAGICPGCGFHHSLADLDPWFTIEDRTCKVCRSMAPQLRVFAAEDTEDASRLQGQPRSRGLRDGKTRVLRILDDPDDVLEARRRAITPLPERPA